jgi:hypothetical protein
VLYQPRSTSRALQSSADNSNSPLLRGSKGCFGRGSRAPQTALCSSVARNPKGSKQDCRNGRLLSYKKSMQKWPLVGLLGANAACALRIVLENKCGNGRPPRDTMETSRRAEAHYKERRCVPSVFHSLFAFKIVVLKRATFFSTSTRPLRRHATGFDPRPSQVEASVLAFFAPNGLQQAP